MQGLHSSGKRSESRAHAGRWTALFAAVALGLGMGCTSARMPAGAETGFDYFARPRADDVWSPKIMGWQRRERFDAALVAPLESGPAVESAGQSDANDQLPESQLDEGGLRAKYFAFRAERKRALAQEVADWIQAEAKVHYREDGAVDHWATLEETLARGGDDCDGLGLLAFHARRDLGFADTEVYRAIVVRPSDGQHHMVTLWFEDAEDPWVIDPTGAMTLGMPRMSSLVDWVPLKVFSDEIEYTVRDRSQSLAQTR
jgi:NTP pyrophosphatase (non-canonical NTP hydrolase)